MAEAKPWHEQDDFWETVSPMQQRWADTPAEVDNLIALLEIAPGAHILDLCCGVGRHSLELARRGFRVTGVDRTLAYLRRAAEQADTEGLEIEFVEEDMRTFCRPDAFDVVINLFTSFGYFEDPDDDRHVVANVYRSLRSGGAFLVEMKGKEVLARVFQERDWDEEDGLLVLQERELSQDWSWIENRWILLKDDSRTELRTGHRLYSAAELTSLLTECGFARAGACGGLDGSPYDQTAKRLAVVAHK